MGHDQLQRYGYKQFIADASLAIERSNHCDTSHLDLLFVQVNSASVVTAAAAARAKGGTNRVRHLVHSFSRSEWMHMLVRLAIMRYIESVLPAQVLLHRIRV